MHAPKISPTLPLHAAAAANAAASRATEEKGKTRVKGDSEGPRREGRLDGGGR